MLNLYPQVYHSWKQVVIRFHGIFLLFQFLPQNCDPWVELKSLSEYLPLGMREQHIEDSNSQPTNYPNNVPLLCPITYIEKKFKRWKKPRNKAHRPQTVDPGLNFLSNSSLRDLFHIYLFHIVPASISNPFYSFPLEMGFFWTVKICLERFIYREKAVSRRPAQCKGKIR